jgi:hypothetical protein
VQLPSFQNAALGAFNCPAIARLRELGSGRLNREKTRHEAFKAVLELRAFLNSQFASPLFAMVLSAARLSNKTLPQLSEWQDGWGRVKARMNRDSAYVGKLVDGLPKIAARYSASNFMRVFNDVALKQLIREGLS